jgi:integrase
VFKKAINIVDDNLLLISMQLAFSCSICTGQIIGLKWEDIVIDDESLANNNARVIINKELPRVSLETMQTLNEKNILKVSPT